MQSDKINGITPLCGRASAPCHFLHEKEGRTMKTVLIIGSVVVMIVVGLTAHEVGSYCSDINPYAPEDYPRGDIGQGY